MANPSAATGTADDKVRKATYATYQSVVYPSQASPVVNVVIDKEEGGRVDVRFKNKNGEVLAERYVGRSASKVSMKFRVDELPDGVYTVEVSNGRDKNTKQITLGTQVQESPRTIALQ